MPLSGHYKGFRNTSGSGEPLAYSLSTTGDWSFPNVSYYFVVHDDQLSVLEHSGPRASAHYGGDGGVK